MFALSDLDEGAWIHGWLREQLRVLNNERKKQRLLTTSIEYITQPLGSGRLDITLLPGRSVAT
jgi:hypothetical protein